ncbi:MAG: D-alanine--D-alanine ligase [Naasia sp.]|jgi:D-alanine-D-alanine ligase|uniref:D-alanine--D-alanine ligase family protein n=1 Tax=Naasia sp. TaxID=2546198 RepID=UPI00260B243F|nr:D-alanine--D-alanine ligase [Naasia sp.]MCU1570279.1 D-alanine--D-alanine ligase [Naasia sp.]
MTSHSSSVLVLAGGISHERDISLRSGRRVADALADQGWQVTISEPDATLLSGLAEAPPDVVWPALHGASGEDGALRALLGSTGVPFVGSDYRAARLAWDKPVAKTLIANAGGVTPRGIALSRETFRELGAPAVLETVRNAMPLPLVVKPARGGSAQGVSIVREAEQLPRAMVDAYTYGDDALVEHFVRGTEIAVGVLDLGEGPTALPAVEIVPEDGDYDFGARYNAGETRFYAPARLDHEVADRAAELAVLAHRALGLRHLSRVDIIVDEDGTPWFLEVNVLPGLTETSLLPQGILADGRNLGEVYAALARRAIADGV